MRAVTTADPLSDSCRYLLDGDGQLQHRLLPLSFTRWSEKALASLLASVFLLCYYFSFSLPYKVQKPATTAPRHPPPICQQERDFIFVNSFPYPETFVIKAIC